MQKKFVAFSFFGIAFFALVLGGCSTRGNAICDNVGVGPPQMLYPIPGSSGVPTNAASVIVMGELVGGASITLTSSGVPTIVGGASQAPPSPLPSPMALGQPQAAYPIAGLAAHTTYAVTAGSAGPGLGCGGGPEQQGGQIGTFTTQ